MSELANEKLANNSDNFCYRHPDRQSFVLCQRCGRTICAACQTQAAVGVHCPECVKEARQNAPRQRPFAVRTGRAIRSGSGMPVVTYTLIALCVVIYAAQLVSGGAVTEALLYYPPLTAIQPWTLVTAIFIHGSPLHLLSNMFSLFILGRILEPVIGWRRYLALFLVSGLGGSVAVLLVAPGIAVLGASGAIFGMLAALFIILRRMGQNTTQIVVLIALNLALGFLFPGMVAWQAHVGGLIVGGLIALVYARTANVRQRRVQVMLVGAIVVVLLVITVVAVALQRVLHS